MDQLHYEYKKKKEPVLLLLHGFLGSMQQWDYVEQLLSESYSILKIDLPGHGKTLEFQQNYNLEELSLLIDRILINEQLKKVHIVGHSMGGYLGCAFAKARPEKTSSLTLINSVASSDSQEKIVLRNRSIQLLEKHASVYVNMAIGNLFTNDERVEFENRITLMKQHAAQISIKSIIQALECMRDRKNNLPLLIERGFSITYIYSKMDGIIPVELVEKEAFTLRSKAEMIDSGHMSLLITPSSIVKNMHFIE